MLIICPSCVSTYRLPDDAVRPQSKVRCAQCGSVFDPKAARGSAVALEPHAVSLARTVEPGGLIRETAFRPSSPALNQRAGVHVSRSALLAGALVAFIGLNMAAVAWRQPIVAALPGLAPVFAAVGLPNRPVLRLDDIETALGPDGADQVLSVQGHIINAGSTATPLPALRIVVRDGAEQSIYSWTAPAPQDRLAPGETADFHSRLDTPPAAGRDVVVSFASTADMASAVRAASEP